MANKVLLPIFICILSCISSQEPVKTLSGQQVHLRCYINSTHDVTWYINLGLTFVPVYTCTESGSCTSLNDVGDRLIRISGSRNNELSIISFIPPRDKLTFECKLGDKNVKSYEVYLINPGSINEYCNVSFPSISESGDHQIILLCGYTFQGDVDLRANLTIKGLGQKHFQTSSENTNRTLHLDDNFNNIDDAFCEIYFPDINITRTCAYPDIIQTKYVIEGNGIIVESDDESEVDWQLFGKDGRKEYIANRSWTRDKGRSLMILGVTEADVGKMVVWRTKGADNQTNNGTMGFTVISDISNKQDPEDKKPAPSRAQSPFFVLTLLFLALWLITTCTVIAICLFCQREKAKPSTSGNEETAMGPEYATAIFNFSGTIDPETDGDKLNGRQRLSIVEEQSKAQYMDMDGKHGRTDYEAMKSLTYKNNDFAVGTTKDGFSAGAGTLEEQTDPRYMGMTGENVKNDYEAIIKGLTYTCSNI